MQAGEKALSASFNRVERHGEHSLAAKSPHRQRILVIEDDLLIGLMIEEMVREAGYRVSGVAHTSAWPPRA